MTNATIIALATIAQSKAIYATPGQWAIVADGKIVGLFASRALARLNANPKAGKIIKVADLTLEVLTEVAAPPVVTLEPAKATNAIQTKVAKANPTAHTTESTVERPCKRVWQIADDVHAANPAAKRGDVLAECVKQGVAYFTARTQYQQWLTVQHEMEARELAAAAKLVK